ncbi:MAG: hypothetical protein HY534_03815 [Chloroflexi bacterium]|nr:hypothetical protein [Chloroflexota bacterium]
MRQEQRMLSLAMIGLIVVAACAPSESAGGGAQPAAPAEVQKTLTIAIQGQPSSFDTQMTQTPVSGRIGGINQIPQIVDDSLVSLDEFGVLQTRMVTEIPTQAKRTWVLNPDGTMDLTWTLRPDVYWHDGAPVTSEDFVFRFTVKRELQLSSGGGGREDLVQSVTARDPRTFVVHWSSVYIGGYREGIPTGGISPLPKHILGDLFAQDREALPISRYFTTEYVGTGPFQLVHWEQGSSMEFRRNERFHLGVPPIHRLFVRFVPDTSTMVANILAGVVDVLLPEGVDLDTAIEVRERWQREGTGHQVNAFVLQAHVQLEIMLNPQYARPVNGWTSIPARQGLYHAIDRIEIAQVMTAGLSPPADSMYAPDDPFLPMVKDYIPQYPYDPARARQLLAQAGWVPGSDGVLVHQPSGERFDTILSLAAGSQYLKLGSMIQDHWKAVGVNTTLAPLTPVNAADASYLATRSGPHAHNPSGNVMYESRLHSRRIPSEATRWTGNNRGHFNNPVVDDVIDRLAGTIDPAQQAALHRQFLQETMGKATAMPLFWETLPILMLKGVTGPKFFGGVATTDIHKWDKN